MRQLTELELDIIMTLADDKGHALWEIAKLLGKEKSNLSLILNRLEGEVELSDPFELSWQDVINLYSLEIKFNNPKDPLSRYIQDQFKPETIQLSNSSFSHSYSSAYPNFNINKVLNNKILNELNRLLNDPNLFDEKRFEHIILTEKIQKMFDNEPKGKDLRYLNRLLLEEAYPQEIAKGVDYIIYKEFRTTTKPNSSQPKHHEISCFLNPNPLVLEYIISNLLPIRPNYKLIKVDKLKELVRLIKSHQFTEEEYRKANAEAYIRSNPEESDEEIRKKRILLERLLSSQYALQIVKKYGFRIIIHRIRNIVLIWNNCWTLAEKAIESGIIKDEADLECAEKLIEFHRSVEEGYRRLEEKNEEDEGDM